MKIFSFGKDGGPKSTVWGAWLIELKWLFSIVLLCFENGSRDEFHSHAFHCISWVLRGKLKEELLTSETINEYKASWKPIITKRTTFHRVVSEGRTWVISFRGPWAKKWFEYSPEKGKFTSLTNGRKIVA